MSTLSDYFASLANKIRSKTGKATTMTPTEMITEVDVVYQAGVDSIQTQAKTAPAVPSGLSVSNATVITPDDGKLLSSVTIPKAFDGNIGNYFNNIQTITISSGYNIQIKDFISNLSIGDIVLLSVATKNGTLSIGTIAGMTQISHTTSLYLKDSSGTTVNTVPTFFIFRITDPQNAKLHMSTSFLPIGYKADVFAAKIAKV